MSSSEYQQILEELNWLEETVKRHTPKVAIAKQLLFSLWMSFILFEHLHGDDLTEVVKAVHETTTFNLVHVRNQLEVSSQYRMNNNGDLEVIGRVIGRNCRSRILAKISISIPFG